MVERGRGMKPTCFCCRKPIPESLPRVCIEGRWWCEDCTYLLNYPNAKRIEKPPRIDPKHPQVEELFL